MNINTPASHSACCAANKSHVIRAVFLLAALLLPVGPVSSAQAAGLTFDGINDYVTFGPAPGLGASTFTIETWFKRTGAGATANTGTSGLYAVPLVTKGRGEADGSNVDMNWFLGLSGDKLAADFEDVATGLNHPVTGATSVSMNVWHHAAAVYDGTTWRLYLDGLLDATNTAGATPRFDSIQHAALGTALNSGGIQEGAFAGVLAQARVWNDARDQAQIAEGMNVLYAAGTPGLLGQWALDETSGTVANDSSGHNLSGTLMNGPLWGDFAPTTVKIVKGPWLQNVTAQSVVVMWETQMASSTRVDYGPTDALGAFVEEVTPRTIHGITLPDLAPNARYYYRVTSGDVSNAINSFISAPGDATVPFRFVAYGDTRSNPGAHKAVVDSILRSGPDFVLHVGDFVNSGRIYSEWEPQYFTPAADMLKGTPLFPALGNHEFSGTGQIWYYDFFSVPDNGVSGYGEHFYGFSYGAARFIGLSACEGCDSFASGTPQYNWLLGQFTSPEFINAKWRIVWMHNPPFTSTQQDNTVDQALRAVLVPLFEQYGVDVVFSGDDHFYRHTLVNGIHYIVTGGGGAPLHAVGTPMAGAEPLYAESAQEHCVIDVTPATFQCWAVRTNGTIMDSFSLVKDATAPAISDVAATDITANSAKITWATDEAANSLVRYGTTAAYDSTASAAAMVTAHAITLTGLQPQTTYYYEVVSADFAGNSSSQAELSLTTLAGNHPPVADSQEVSTPEDTALQVVLTGRDADNDALTLAVLTSPSHGSLTGTAPNLTYTPALDYNGTDSFTFKVNDGYLDSAPATVTIAVSAVNDAPVADDQTLTTTAATPLSLTLTATDVDSAPLTYLLVTFPGHGTLNGTAPNLTYTPEAGFTGADSFTFNANDGLLESQQATVQITVTAVPPQAPSRLTATAVSKSQIDLKWVDNSADETGFKVQRSSDNVAFTTVGTVESGVTAYSSTGLAANRQYFFRVCAFNSAGDSAFSNTAKTRTLKK